MSNPNYGVFDLETFKDSANIKDNTFSRVFAVGFKTKMEIQTYFLTDHFPNSIEGSANLVLHCLDNMLTPKYNNYIFYVHNLGKFDVIFLYKILLDYNEKVASLALTFFLYVRSKKKLGASSCNSRGPKGQPKYILDPLYRDNHIIRLIVKLNSPQKLKISFVDSLNLLDSSLDKLCKDFNIKTSKGIYPYAFVNKDNLNYVGCFALLLILNIIIQT